MAKTGLQFSGHFVHNLLDIFTTSVLGHYQFYIPSAFLPDITLVEKVCMSSLKIYLSFTRLFSLFLIPSLSLTRQYGSIATLNSVLQILSNTG